MCMYIRPTQHPTHLERPIVIPNHVLDQLDQVDQPVVVIVEPLPRHQLPQDVKHWNIEETSHQHWLRLTNQMLDHFFTLHNDNLLGRFLSKSKRF